MTYNATTGLSTLDGIMGSLRRGLKVRRTDWPEDAYLVLDGDEFQFCRSLGKPRPFIVRGSDFIDHAWDEVREYTPDLANAAIEGSDFEGVPV